MKTMTLKRAGVLFLLVIVSFLVIALFAEEEKVIPLKDTPAAVKATIEKQAEGKKIGDIELKTKDGKSIYEVELKEDGKEKIFMVDADGKFLGFGEVEEDEGEEQHEKEGKEGKECKEGKENEDKDDTEKGEIAISELPALVRQSAEKYLGDLKSAEAKKELENNVTTYDVEVKKDGAEVSAEFSESGEIIEMEKKLKPSQLPPAIVAAVMAQYPGAKIKEAIEIKPFENGQEKPLNYEVMIIAEIKFSADGVFIPETQTEKETKKEKE
jgi:hypothetical protein